MELLLLCLREIPFEGRAPNHIVVHSLQVAIPHQILILSAAIKIREFGSKGHLPCLSIIQKSTLSHIEADVLGKNESLTDSIPYYIPEWQWEALLKSQPFLNIL